MIGPKPTLPKGSRIPSEVCYPVPLLIALAEHVLRTDDFFLVITFVYIVDVLVRLIGLGWNSFRANGWNLFDVVVTTGSFVSTFIVRFGQSNFVWEQLQKLFLVSIAFKLVQRTDSLNRLFKTAMWGLPIPSSLRRS